jgi:anaerobic carbon-monoxide dehydrogenase iron sulfur subunit
MPHVMINNKKCTGCHMCELACSAWHEGAYRPSVARLSVSVNPTTITVRGKTCLQTACAKCEEACPEGAIRREPIVLAGTAAEAPAPGDDPGGGGSAGGDSGDGDSAAEAPAGYVLVVDEAACTNCGICYSVCPYGVLFEHPDRHVAVKCDLCGGEPQCITFCQNPHVLAVSVKLSKADRELAAG